MHAPANTPGYLRDLSSSGCQISFVKHLPVQKQDVLPLIIIPGEEIGIPTFRVSLKVHWTSLDTIYFSLGGKIDPLPGKENEERLKKLYDYYNS